MVESIGRVPEPIKNRLIEPEAVQSRQADTLLRASLDRSGYPAELTRLAPSIPINEKHLEKPVGLLAITLHAQDISRKLNKHRLELPENLQNPIILSYMSHLIANVNMYQYTPEELLISRASNTWQEQHKQFPLHKEAVIFTEHQLKKQGFIKQQTVSKETSKLYLTENIDPFLY
jgi:hypothetical protein